jgi:hypothetical protein
MYDTGSCVIELVDLKGRDHLRDLGVDGRMILIKILMK